MLNEKYQKIQFGPGFPDLKSYESRRWDVGETYSVEFFEDQFVNVTLISSDSPELESYLSALDDGGKIAIDLEWEDEISLIQFCSSKFVLIIKHVKGPGNILIYSFLSTHRFYGKGMHNDKKQLMNKFGSTFSENFEDIALTRLIPYGNSENFVKMTLQFAGKPKAEFKDIEITKSNWESKILSSRQILYAAFDVVALYVAYPNFPPPKEIVKEHRTQTRAPKVDKNNPENIPLLSKINDNNRKCKPLKERKQKTNMKVTFNPVEVTHTYSYICKAYNGIKSLVYLRSIFKNIDFVSLYEKNDGTCYLFLSLLEPLDRDFTYSCAPR